MQVPATAKLLMAESEYGNSPNTVLSLVNQSTCSAYGCEFIALAKQLSICLITQDKKTLIELPDIAISISDFLNWCLILTLKYNNFKDFQENL